MGQMAVGLYQTACEASPNRQQINVWLNEGKANIWISRELKKQYGEQISDKSIAKYRKYREDQVQKELEADPDYQGKMQLLNDNLTMGISKVKAVDVMSHLCDVIENSAEMLADARDRDVKIESAQDMRYVTQNMLDAIKVYGDTILKAQKQQEIEKDPTLLKPTTINLNVRSALGSILQEMVNGGGYDVIDRLRNAKTSGTSDNEYDARGFSGDTVDYRSSVVDGDEENSEG